MPLRDFCSKPNLYYNIAKSWQIPFRKVLVHPKRIKTHGEIFIKKSAFWTRNSYRQNFFPIAKSFLNTTFVVLRKTNSALSDILARVCGMLIIQWTHQLCPNSHCDNSAKFRYRKFSIPIGGKFFPIAMTNFLCFISFCSDSMELT